MERDTRYVYILSTDSPSNSSYSPPSDDAPTVWRPGMEPWSERGPLGAVFVTLPSRANASAVNGSPRGGMGPPRWMRSRGGGKSSSSMSSLWRQSEQRQTCGRHVSKLRRDIAVITHVIIRGRRGCECVARRVVEFAKKHQSLEINVDLLACTILQ